MRQKILVVEEDAAARKFLAEQLTVDGYTVLAARSRTQAVALLSACDPELVLADVNGETLGLLDAIREGAEGLGGRVAADTPMIVLTADGDELSRLRVFDHEGDDVLVKPYSYLELRARIEAVLRRTRKRRKDLGTLRAGPLRIDLGARAVRAGDRHLELSKREYDLLRVLASDPGRVFTRQELLQGVWQLPAELKTRTLDTHAFRLRRKLREATGLEFVTNVWGIGYALYRTAEVDG